MRDSSEEKEDSENEPKNIKVTTSMFIPADEGQIGKAKINQSPSPRKSSTLKYSNT